MHDLFIETDSNFSHNRASRSGGGVYAELTSYVTVSSTVHFYSNHTIDRYGGGISSQNASVALGSTIEDFVYDTARFGGGASLANSNLNGITNVSTDLYVNIISDYGGALYANDMLDCISISYDAQLKCLHSILTIILLHTKQEVTISLEGSWIDVPLSATLSQYWNQTVMVVLKFKQPHDP